MPVTTPDIAEAVRQLKATLSALQPARHSLDFCSVVWFGKSYLPFTPTQAAIVRILWDAWLNDTPDVRQDTLLSEANSDSGRVADVFKDHPAWGAMIQSKHRGTFRLVELEG